MVSFWPFRGGDTSAAGFEKILSSLSQKINKASAKDARLRSQQRRLRVLWTLYTAFAYLVALLILVLVVGRREWGTIEYSGLAGSPIAIYGVRLAIDAVYNYRLAGTQGHLEDLQKQRSDTIEKLKAATKYNSTQQLLDKYGGGGGGNAGDSGSKQTKSPPGKQSRKSEQNTSPQARVQRTGIAPPPTANIQRPQAPGALVPPTPVTGQSPSSAVPEVTAEFAPNAFTETPAPIPNSQGTMQMQVHTQTGPPRWYDRVMDAILGEDETSPRNRIALICSTCRLVNGQAPPGTRTLEDLGRWRCMACGANNGVQSVAEKAVSDAIGSAREAAHQAEVENEGSEGEKPGSTSDDEDTKTQAIDEVESDTPAKSTARATRSQAMQRKK
ncbi:hypothetical protein K461DRAFT_266823 [Myriangium duriaei CBS 260.36]|uniref:Endoplasmic reticulum junction formation protein lunapark n=1 Tax=Myriangium duriaei CBS 260.36 TaxID=1168546 RepID=A0A9P4J7C6_9PEZI|nr:hypothetical protein K461DRAFT_266823 [Myriangium duriaei CBS 260.36]